LKCSFLSLRFRKFCCFTVCLTLFVFIFLK
jgi:hypothetical protein